MKGSMISQRLRLVLLHCFGAIIQVHGLIQISALTSKNHYHPRRRQVSGLPTSSRVINSFQRRKPELHSVFNQNREDPEFQVLFPTVNQFDLPRLLTLSIPAFVFLGAFACYKETSLAFHNFVNIASGNTWLPADGGQSLTDLITPALNGPVSTVISLLFGTLVSTTIGNLYNRQNELSCLLATIFDDIRLAEIHADFFPQPYKQRAYQLLQDFTISIIEDFEMNNGDFEAEVEKLRDRRELGMLVFMFHEMDADPNVGVPGGVLGEAYGTVNRIISARSDLIATYNNCFPPWCVL
jgi:hypothetical protein